MPLGAVAVALAKRGRAEESVVKRMLAASPHRGTRQQVASLGSCALGVSNQDEQPDASLAVGERLAAVFVGSLDNLAELADELNVAATRTPAELVVEAFGAWGAAAAPAKMRGVYGVVVTDGHELWCFQDHFGFAHLYYRDDPGLLCVATEPKQVVAGAGIPKEPDLEVVERLFYADIDTDIEAGDLERQLGCALKGVRRFPKASVVSSAQGRLHTRRYWNPEGLLESGRFSPHELQERFDELMGQAVTRALGGDDVVSLSGGIDSPAVAAFATGTPAGAGTTPVAALSSVLPDYPSVDESGYVQMVVDKLQMPLHTYVSEALPLDDIDEWVRLLDGPAPVLPPGQAAEHYRRARKLGFRTMLTGEYAEFIFEQNRYLVPHLLWRGRIPAAWRYLRQQRALGVQYKSMALQLTSGFLPRPARLLYWRWRRSSTITALPPWLDERRVTGTESSWVAPTRHRWGDVQLALAREAAIGSEAGEMCESACGLQVRRPWADVDLYEFFLSIPAEQKFPYPRRAGKVLVRELLRGRVPDPILDRQEKTVFTEVFMSRIDYDTFRRLLVNPKHRLPGVRYDVLAERLDSADFDMGEYKWALDLAKSHAFLAQW